jgi:uncharacterized oligopeptide transporter (OPT) family protein
MLTKLKNSHESSCSSWLASQPVCSGCIAAVFFRMTWRGGESLVLADRAAGIITGLSAVYPGMGGSTGHRIGFAMLEGVSTGWRLLSAPGLFRESVKHDRRELPAKLGLKSWH